MSKAAYSYRDDPLVPDFDDSKALFVFDNVCVLCTGGAGFIMRHDPQHKVNFTSAQDQLGSALCRHYEHDWDTSYIIIRNGKLFTKSSGYFELARELGGWWRCALVFQIVPRFISDRVYETIARNRYKWFGKTKQACSLLTPEQRARLI